MFGGIGKALGAMDDNYARAIRKTGAASNPPSWMDAPRTFAAGNLGMRRDNEKHSAFIRGANTAARYALPAAGVTAAGIGLMDLAAQFGGSADQPEQNQLGLNNGELSALGVVLASPLVAGGAGAGVDMFGLSGDGGLGDAVSNPDQPGAIRRR